jgi:hypothetical protein
MAGSAIQMHKEEAITPFAPQGLEQAMRLAEVLSKSGLLPDALRGKPADVLVTLITGHELGLSPMQSVRGLHVVQGKAVMSADLTVGLVLRRRDVCEFFRLVKSDDKIAEYQTKRVGSEPVTMAYTIAQASTAGLTGSRTGRRTRGDAARPVLRGARAPSSRTSSSESTILTRRRVRPSPHLPSPARQPSGDGRGRGRRTLPTIRPRRPDSPSDDPGDEFAALRTRSPARAHPMRSRR